MQQFSLLLESEAEARAVMARLWDKMKVRGEIQMVPMAVEGRTAYKLDVITEKDLTPAQLEKLPGKRLS
ncbi:conserved protein of unknown function [Candidatus Hydrogenisulfobacillus filiaventi]|uniref:Uncharacterized protein n=1 Tax=Candidatus Hydrogenisulfobacillus filiaventi TaxID=2707344 RepID=A0A6F8ZG08_9FIRM|nr:hypothetical protein [Bacillota bacterium]CAB1128637.1 conserved protein of unknown function [Candidatus Hydrogenisulfobacillus filiaventi]